MVLTEASWGTYILLSDRMRLDIQAQICSCALLQSVYDNQLDGVPEFCHSKEKILVPGGSWLLNDKGQGLPIPLSAIQQSDSFFMLGQPSSVTSNSHPYRLYEINENFSNAR